MNVLSEQISDWKHKGDSFAKQENFVEAEKAYQKGLALMPSIKKVGLRAFKQALYSLGDVFEGLGSLYNKQNRLNDMIFAFSQALKCQPENTAFMIHFSHSIRRAQFTQVDEAVKDAFFLCLNSREINHQNLAIPGISLLKLNPEFLWLMNLIHRDDNEAIIKALHKEEHQKQLHSSLWINLLKKAILADPEIEKMLATLRRFFLFTCEDSLFNPLLSLFSPFLYALARQCRMTEYVYSVSPSEEKALAHQIHLLTSSYEQKEFLFKEKITLISSYTPLSKFNNLPKELLFEWGATDPDFQDLVNVQLLEPEIEQTILTKIPCLHPLKNRISQKIQWQYEENPYPQWHSLDRHLPKQMHEYLQELTPEILPNELQTETQPKILIAGCGTGKQAIECALQLKNGSILALDLSLKSLAYAMRMAEKWKISNIQFHQGDILDLKRVNFTFDLIECTGVLHHMEEPLKGWSILRSLLKPEGWMLIGLYSTLGRADVAEARRMIAEKGYQPCLEDIRRCRETLRSLSDNPLLHKVSQSLDFYTTSSCRDLLFNAHETSFTLPEIKEILHQLRLEFMGFTLKDPNVKQLYPLLFPNDTKRRSLDRWNEFEEKYPDTFIGMYQFLAKAYLFYLLTFFSFLS